MKHSIIIPVFNKKNFTESCLKDLSHLSPSYDTEVIVVDNASTDGTKELLESALLKMPNLKIITNEENLGFGRALNKGYEQSTGEFVLFLNNDIRVKSSKKDWINILTNRCKDDMLVSPTGGFIDPKDEFKFKFETHDSKRFKETNYLSGWCIGGKRATLDKLVMESNQFKGPWNEKFFAYFEDGDLSFRARRIGMTLDMLSIPVVHFGRITSGGMNLNQMYNQSRKIFIEQWKNIK